MRKKQIKERFEVRPIGARALKSATDTLRPWIPEAQVLDLFCGQGRFGLACLDEGASHVDLVDTAPKLIREVEAEIKKHRYPGKAWVEDAFQFLKRAAENERRYEIIFADPPFPLWNENFSDKLFATVALVAAKGAILLVKYPAGMVASLPVRVDGISLWKTTVFGESELVYFRSGELKSTNAGQGLES